MVQMNEIEALPLEDRHELCERTGVGSRAPRARCVGPRDVTYALALEICHPRPWGADAHNLEAVVSKSYELRQKQVSKRQVDRRHVCDFEMSHEGRFQGPRCATL